MEKNKNSQAKLILPNSYQKKSIAIGKIKITLKGGEGEGERGRGGGQISQQLFELIVSTLSNELLIVVQSPVSLLEHPSSSMSCRFT